jgi:long-chain acyl-CoA synthetase
MEMRHFVKADRIFDAIPALLNKENVEDAFVAKENGVWVKYSTQQFSDYVTNLSSGLLNLGIAAQDKIAIIANNRPEWNFIDFGIQQTGAVSVPIYPTISDTDLEFILNDAQVKFIFVSSEELYTKVKAIAAKAQSVKAIYAFDKVEGAKNWMELVESGKKNPKISEVEAIKATIKPNDLLTILYTSGTTGNPKGVMLSHHNLLSNAYSCEKALPDIIKMKPTWKVLSFLPLNHVYERMLVTTYILGGASVYYAESIDTIGENLKEVKPDGFASVPRIFEKVYEKIMATGHSLEGIKRKIFMWAIDLGFDYELEGKGWWYNIQLDIARKLVFSKWKEAVGGNLISSMSGGAALQPRLARIFAAAGIPICEGYGLTETSPVIATNTLEPGGMRFGTVGRVIDGVTVKIAEDGEILVKGPNVMLGYYNNPEATAEVIDTDGWFHTGDIGEVSKDGFLRITDRKKQIFKTSGGKYIAPAPIENKLQESPYIEQSMVVGEYQKFASALIVPSFIKLKEWCRENGITYTTDGEMIKNEKVKQLITQEVEKVNIELAQYEKIKQPVLLAQEWTVIGGQLTPKLSYRRKVITSENKEVIEKIYDSVK